MRNGGEQGHLSFLQKSGWGTVGEGGLVITAYIEIVLAARRSNRDGVTYGALESHALVDAEEQDNRATSMECISEEACVLLLSGPNVVSLRINDILHVPGFDDEESFVGGCLEIRVSEYVLDTRMLPF